MRTPPIFNPGSEDRFPESPVLALAESQTCEFAIVEPLVNVLAANIFQIPHGRRQVFVAEPFLQFADTANITFQIDGGKCVQESKHENCWGGCCFAKDSIFRASTYDTQFPKKSWTSIRRDMGTA